jgi:hypothetical protein
MYEIINRYIHFGLRKHEIVQRRNFNLRPSKTGMWFRINDITFGFILKATKLLKMLKLYNAKAIPRVTAVDLNAYDKGSGFKVSFYCGKHK